MTHNNHCTQAISSFAVPHKDIVASRSYKNLAVIHNCRHRIAYNLDGLTYRDATKEIVKQIKHCFMYIQQHIPFNLIPM